MKIVSTVVWRCFCRWLFDDVVTTTRRRWRRRWQHYFHSPPKIIPRVNLYCCFSIFYFSNSCIDFPKFPIIRTHGHNYSRYDVWGTEKQRIWLYVKCALVRRTGWASVSRKKNKQEKENNWRLNTECEWKKYLKSRFPIPVSTVCTDAAYLFIYLTRILFSVRATSTTVLRKQTRCVPFAKTMTLIHKYFHSIAVSFTQLSVLQLNNGLMHSPLPPIVCTDFLSPLNKSLIVSLTNACQKFRQNITFLLHEKYVKC